ncbi:hypothetical protein C0Q70_14546 [Pomacea canaliculata]|uniref:Protein kinase domain-containing protein n=1 Tax=Pomacea canaliculata TaxID=400727 RepID=A0A2T7NSE5_POMCA|nr:hypothetical protein C0Q70_14546 [Pomacea canaliculata]
MTSLRHLTGERLRCPLFSGCEQGQLESMRCEWCPPFQRPLAGQGSCQCMEGYEYVEESNGPCQPCPNGFYKPEVDNSACIRCLKHSVTLTEGASACVCAKGYTESENRECKACPRNTYKEQHGPHSCRQCPEFSTSPAGSTSIEQCTCRQGHKVVTGLDTVTCQGAPNVSEKGSGEREHVTGTGGLDLGKSGKPLITTRGLYTYVTSEHLPSTGGPQQIQPESMVAIGVGIVVVMATVIVIMLLSLLCARRQRVCFRCFGLQYSPLKVEVTVDSGIVTHSTSSFRQPIKRLHVGHLIGKGAFGQVHEGVVRLSHHDSKDWTRVAVKRLKDKASEDERQILQQELEQMLLVGHHPNIIRLLGSCVHQGEIQQEVKAVISNKQCSHSSSAGNLYIIMELATGGDLLSYLRNQKLRHEQYVSVAPDGTVSEQKVLQVTTHSDLMLFAWHIARGMSHLESVKCIHRDLAARNCLLTSGPVAKLSDFGLSKDVYENGYYFRKSKGRIPYKWLSPEALLWGQYSSKSDVWSYGILLWEVATFGGTPYAGIPPDRICDMHQSHYRLPQPPSCPDPLYRVMRCCWQEDPRKRPTFRRLCDVLELFVQNSSDRKYLDLQPHTSPLQASDLDSGADCPLGPSRFGRRAPSLSSSKRLSTEVTYVPPGTYFRSGDTEDRHPDGGGTDIDLEMELEPILRELGSQWSDTGTTHAQWQEEPSLATHALDTDNTSGYFSNTRALVQVL